MAVVTGYGTGYKNPAALKAVEAVYAEATMKVIPSLVSIANGDSIASVYFVGRVPSNAIILPLSRYDNAAITGAAGSLGFSGAVAALVSAASLATAGTASAIAAVAAGNLNKKAWELAGLASDPGGMLDIFLTLTAAATAAGAVEYTLVYAKGV